MIIREKNKLKRRESLLFVNKKKQKTLSIGAYRPLTVRPDPIGQKFFASFF